MSYSSDQPISSKPYELVPFPKQSPKLEHPAGHDRYKADHLHGSLELSLTVGTTLHVSTGVIATGKDIDKSGIPLVKTMMVEQKKLVIPGSSLKGVVRSAYEAITNSTLGADTKESKKLVDEERYQCKKKDKDFKRPWLCPASQVFGAMDWQGLLQFSDATGTSSNFKVDFMPSLYQPRPKCSEYVNEKGRAAGRKFYYHAVEAINRAKYGVDAQQAGRHYQFTTALNFPNLTPAQLGTVLIVLGQDSDYPMALKVGGGKPIGMGTMTVTVASLNLMGSNFDRYRSYAAEPEQYSGEQLITQIQPWLAAAHRELIESAQLADLAEVLKYPTDREAPAGMY
ncbi:MAG: CRISPR-associated protein [Synechococcales cyanobacterium RM1_1_8]|nr:CRISPR-associated protein [Synechococcales cyanobacterium RM1_1_8]